MQWRRRKRSLHVIGSANHALLLKEYSTAGAESGTEDECPSPKPVPSTPSQTQHHNHHSNRKLIHTETHVYNDGK